MMLLNAILLLLELACVIVAYPSLARPELDERAVDQHPFRLPGPGDGQYSPEPSSCIANICKFAALVCLQI